MLEDVQFYVVKVIGLAAFAGAIAVVVACAENVITRLKGSKRSGRA